MNRAQYLDAKYVSEFLQWLAQRAQSGVPRRAGDTRWEMESLCAAYQRYTWRGQDFAANQQTLTRLSAALHAALERGSPSEFVAAGLEVFRWGGPSEDNVTTLKNYGATVIPVFRAAIAQLDPATGDTHRIDNVPDMNSGFSKIFALLVDGFPIYDSRVSIYDSRVSAALGYFVREFLTERGCGQIPDTLAFAQGGGRSTRKNRNPSTGTLRFPGMGAFPHGARTRSNLMAAWLISSLTGIGCFAELQPATRVRAIEAALFMVGDEIPLQA